MKKIYLRALSSLLLIVFLLGMAACSPDGDANKNDVTSDGEEDQQEAFDYSSINVDEYVSELVYRDHKIALADKNASREDAVWQKIISTAKISALPQAAVNYYFEQTKKYYLFLVDGDPQQYELLLNSRKITEADMMADAEDMVRDDLVYHYILKKENITLNDSEKLELFDKYVQKYVDEYGYKSNYVVANMKELIYESMLYDKTMEYLLLCNDFEIAEQE